MTDKPRLTLADIFRTDLPPYESPDLSPTDPFNLAETIKEALRKMEEADARPLVKMCNPGSKCQECGKRVADHSTEEGNAHVHSLPGWWE